jgi:photosystem II stability/assembly factor-like uncharacterized protein
MFTRMLLFAAAIVALGAGPAPRRDRWRIIGPGGGGAQFVPTISPHDPNRVFVACDMTGAYVSNDGGSSWRMFNLRDRVRYFVFDPIDRNTIYAQTSALWRSVDGGVSWQVVYPDPNSVEGMIMPDDHAEAQLMTAAGRVRPFTALAIDPTNSKTLYASMNDGASDALLVSKDRGASWTKGSTLPGPARIIVVNKGVYAIGSDFVVAPGEDAPRKTPGHFIDVSAGFNEHAVVIYGIDQDHAYVSEDGGAHWREAALPGGARLRAVATSMRHPDVAYVSYEALKSEGVNYFGVAVSRDSGRTWKLAWKEDGSPAPNVHDVWISERFGPSWAENPLNLGVSPTNPDLVYGTDFGRTMRSRDGGKTWDAVYSTRTPEGAFATTGLDVTTCYGVHFDPFDARRMFISYTDIGLFRSEDGGKSWTSATIGAPRPWWNTTYWMVFDPAVRGRAWAVMSGTHDLPRPKMWRRTSIERYRGGVAMSEDGGKTWRASSNGMPQTAATHILLDERSPVGARVLYVAAFGRGVYKSTDGGLNWRAANEGLPGPEPFAWRLAQDRNGILYLVLARRSEDGSFGNAGDGSVYRSNDGAAHWSRVNLPPGVNGPNGIAIDPRDPGRMYVAAWGRSTPTKAVDGGIFLSTDGGGSWRNVLASDQHIYDISIDPRDARKLYACGFESNAWRSTDAGEHWTRIRGYNFKWGHRVIPDPGDASQIYITTFGGSVWHGPAAGDAAAPEDIASPGLAYTKH